MKKMSWRRWRLRWRGQGRRRRRRRRRRRCRRRRRGSGQRLFVDEIKRKGKLQITLKMAQASFGVCCYCYILKNKVEYTAALVVCGWSGALVVIVILSKQGWIHSYFSHVWVVRGVKKAKRDRRMGRAGCKVECIWLKKPGENTLLCFTHHLESGISGRHKLKTFQFESFHFVVADVNRFPFWITETKLKVEERRGRENR